MNLKVSIINDKKFVEGVPGKLLVTDLSAINSILEVCFSDRVKRILLHSENLAEAFFDLSSGMAGAIFQKLRNYGIHVAIVLSPDVKLSSRFSEVDDARLWVEKGRGRKCRNEFPFFQ
jgi:hypothetical protein